MVIVTRCSASGVLTFKIYSRGNTMKKVLIAAAAATVIATSANAGGIVTHTPEAVIIADTASSSQGIFVPIFAVLFVLLATHH